MPCTQVPPEKMASVTVTYVARRQQFRNKQTNKKKYVQLFKLRVFSSVKMQTDERRHVTSTNALSLTASVFHSVSLQAMADFSLADALSDDVPGKAAKTGHTNPSAPSNAPPPTNPGWPGTAPGGPNYNSAGGPGQPSPPVGFPGGLSGPGAPNHFPGGQPGQFPPGPGAAGHFPGAPSAPGGYPPGPGVPGQFPHGPGAPGQFPPMPGQGYSPSGGSPGQFQGGGPVPYPPAQFPSTPGGPPGPCPNMPYGGGPPGPYHNMPYSGGPPSFPHAPAPGFPGGGFPAVPPGSWGQPAGGFPAQPGAPGSFGHGPMGPYGGPGAPGGMLSVPYEMPLHAGVMPRLMITIIGKPVPGADRFNIDFVKESDVVFHFNPRFPEQTIVRNSFLGGYWGPEEREGSFPFIQGQQFELKILVEGDMFKVAVDGIHLLEYEHRTGGLEDVTLLRVVGDVALYSVAPSLI
ncbi:galectin-3 isoform X1 [Denticeps clupeoides]|uniref:galectin-3 isoform X1 n=1 Tax=Denticeps clupeoides TaxID=299321 RepID=UPI0010A3D60F|nr:galectin-3-like isoform X1 [Denticeps clupeoides]